jgi:hypothetical protein
MSLADLVRNAVATAKSVTAGLQVSITHEPFSSDDANGNRSYGASATYSVIVSHKSRWVSSKDRTGQLSKSNIQFLESVAVTEQDRITLPDGSQPQILSVEDVLDPDGNFYAPRIFF